MLKSVASSGGGSSGGSGIISPSQIITVSGTSRTLSAGDNGTILYCTNAAAITITCAAGLGAGFSVTIIQGGAGKVTIAAGGQTFVSYENRMSTMGQYAIITLISPVANTFVGAGNISP